MILATPKSTHSCSTQRTFVPILIFITIRFLLPITFYLYCSLSWLGCFLILKHLFLKIGRKTNKLTGHDRTGQGGQDRDRQGRAGHNRTEQDRTGKGRTGQDWTGQDSSGQDRKGQHLFIDDVEKQPG